MLPLLVWFMFHREPGAGHGGGERLQTLGSLPASLSGFRESSLVKAVVGECSSHLLVQQSVLNKLEGHILPSRVDLYDRHQPVQQPSVVLLNPSLLSLHSMMSFFLRPSLFETTFTDTLVRTWLFGTSGSFAHILSWSKSLD